MYFDNLPQAPCLKLKPLTLVQGWHGFCRLVLENYSITISEMSPFALLRAEMSFILENSHIVRLLSGQQGWSSSHFREGFLILHL